MKNRPLVGPLQSAQRRSTPRVEVHGRVNIAAMSLPIGADVVVGTFGNKRGVVIAVGGKGRYQVRLDRVTMWCREEDLETPPEDGKKKPRRAARAETPALRDDAAPPGCVDLHGLRVEEAIARVVDEIDRALLRGADRVEVVHGKGSGRVRDALHRHLASMSVVVAAFRLDPANPGVTWVYL